MDSERKKSFNKCSICNQKPATVDCVECKIQFCFTCDDDQHKSQEKKEHQKKLITYSKILDQFSPKINKNLIPNQQFSNQKNQTQLQFVGSNNKQQSNENLNQNQNQSMQKQSLNEDLSNKQQQEQNQIQNSNIQESKRQRSYFKDLGAENRVIIRA
ncbi:hypothetical protein PPERSA_09135 [Pseudocohnilembus persalinus]|uniref:B box-type domain-containing protein n=1 Tax=Pseudocohnilembus persalinus TaxID=266149 RepID=A0A0V0QXB8_PSEPJ|nr:hypothetical protein PPERSA_09135 [Pseudocohnilembus persalinus]|eukprot:KRX06733.1 hypothetical protein PPERSA_09135 [Pseudocohnilembus persalinus]